MRKATIVAFVIALSAIAAGPALAGKPTNTKSYDRGANAFWYTKQWLSATHYRSTVWYVGVYQSSDGTFSDLYFDSSVCEVTPPEDTCRIEFSRYGFRRLRGDAFTIDAKRLASAHLDAVYRLQAYDADYNPVGDPVRTHIVTDWTGIGSLTREQSSYSLHTPCGTIRYRTNGISRLAEATGSLEGTDLGETDDGYLAKGVSRSIDRTC
jgi:hypothetical protein